MSRLSAFLVIGLLAGCAAGPPVPSSVPTPAPERSAEASVPAEGTDAVVAFARGTASSPGEVIVLDLDSTEERSLGAAPGARPIAFTTDGGSLVVAEPINEYRSTLVRYDLDDGARTELIEVFVVYSAPSRSPDGGFIAFGSDGAAPNGLVVLDLVSGEAAQVSTDGAKGTPVWSPDSRWIAYEAFRATPAGGFNDAFILSVDGGEPRQLTSDEFTDTPIAWTDDSSLVLWSDRGTDQSKFSSSTWTIDVESGALEHQPGLDERGEVGMVSPDGTWEAVLSDTILELRPTNGTQDRNVLDNDADVSTQLTWSPSGEWLIWTTRVDGQLDLSMVRVPDGDPIQLTRTDEDEFFPVWGPTGR